MKQIAEDFLRGTGCAACAVLFTAVSFFSGDVLTAFIAAAGTLYLCIFLMRSPDKAFRRRRTLTAFLMCLPLFGICCLLAIIQPDPVLGNAVFSDYCLLLVIWLPGAFLLLGIAAVYAAKQKTHPVIPLAVMYVLYAVLQADAFRLALKDTLSTDPLIRITYTQDARRGFFALCTLAVIHFAVIILLNRKRKKGACANPNRLTGLAAALCLYTVFITAAVLAQLTVYIRMRGLSERRISAAWFAVFLGIAFLVLLIRQFVRRLPSAVILTVLAAVMSGMLYSARPAARIAEYNISRYESGSLDELDIPMLCTLSADAYAVMAQHPDALKRAEQWDYYLEHAKQHTFAGKEV